MNHRHRTTLVALLAATLAAACGPVGFRYAARATVSPPAPYVEVVGQPPGPNYQWVNGYWGYDGSQYSWVRGHWDVPPSPNYVWVRSGWVRDGGRYSFVRGRWAPRGRVDRPNYIHRATVRVRPGVQYQTVRPAVRVQRPGRGRRYDDDDYGRGRGRGRGRGYERGRGRDYDYDGGRGYGGGRRHRR